MELPGLDLNLVVVLHALLEERNVTRAGRRVGLSQPGASAALARLRRHFDDELLARVGVRYELTPLAQGLYDQLGPTVDQLQQLLRAQLRFEPETAERRFVVHCSDATLAVLGPHIVAEVNQAAPNVVLDIGALDPNDILKPLDQLKNLDILIAPRGFFAASEIPSVMLFEDHWLCATWRGNTSIGERLTIEQASAAKWVVPFHHPLISPVHATLSTWGVDRRCAVRVENFTVIADLIVGTDLLVLIPARLYDRYPHDELRLLDLPLELPNLTHAVYWHPSR
ncbi:LysR family transcriptional regulator [Nocardia sp. NPDC005366]|uniref:LysR family transcriptional regulator n=1 Tax=Nocardia sp. NPDC005366 TaxID=3156878 RepID=UPI0033B78E27